MTFVRTLITFSLGIYAGMYTSQNYQVPKVESPKELYERLSTYLSTYKKKERLKTRKFNFIFFSFRVIILSLFFCLNLFFK